MIEGGYWKFEKTIHAIDARFVVENDDARCTVRFPGSARTCAFDFSSEITDSGLHELLETVLGNLMYKKKMPAEVSEWFDEMDFAGVRLVSHATDITHYFRHKSGETREFSYERALLRPDYRRELLEWANQTY